MTSFNLKRNKDKSYIGPGIWYTLHFLSKNDKSSLNSLAILIRDHFPCAECREHFGKMLKTYKFTDNPALDWYNIHNIVNVRLNKKIPDISILDRKPSFQEKEIFGPGIWWIIHSSATFDQKLMLNLCNNLVKNMYPNSRDKISSLNHIEMKKDNYVRWAWDFHDYINAILHRTSPMIENVINFYEFDKGCTKGCGGEHRNVSYKFR